jgi:hypothetical protein
MKKLISVKIILLISAGLFSLPISAQADDRMCDYCYDDALADCNISNPSDNQDCFDETYKSCIDDCCYDYCYYDFESPSCEPCCQEECNNQCGEDENCMDECMVMCLFSDDSICYTDCVEPREQCYDECRADFEDMDGDGIADEADNCPNIANPDQHDNDNDLIGDACDNCIDMANHDQLDGDEDGSGNVCDLCPDVFSTFPTEDLDGDGTGDACDNDIDDDGIENDIDNCPFEKNPEQEDQDADSVGDACDFAMVHLGPELYTLINPEFSSQVALQPGQTVSPIALDPGQGCCSCSVCQFSFFAFDIYNFNDTPIVSGFFDPKTSLLIRNGFILGDNFDGDSSTNDATRLRVITDEEGMPANGILRGIMNRNNLVGEFKDEGRTYGFSVSRNYNTEQGLWSYDSVKMDYPDSIFTSVWDAAFVPALGTKTLVGRYKDSAAQKTHGFTFQQMSNLWMSIDFPAAYATYASGINSGG